MNFIIGVILDKYFKPYGYRLLNLKDYTFFDAKTDDIIDNFYKLNIINYELYNGKLVVKRDSERNFPQILLETGQHSNNKPIILYRDINDKYIVTDATGRVREVPCETIDKVDPSRLANPDWYALLKHERKEAVIKMLNTDNRYHNGFVNDSYDIIDGFRGKFRISSNKRTSGQGKKDYTEIIKFSDNVVVSDDKTSGYSKLMAYSSSYDDVVIEKDNLVNADIDSIYINGNLIVNEDAIKGCRINEIFVNGDLILEHNAFYKCAIGRITVHGTLHISSLGIFGEGCNIYELCLERVIQHLGNADYLNKLDNVRNIIYDKAKEIEIDENVNVERESEPDAIRVVKQVMDIPEGFILTLEKVEYMHTDVRFTNKEGKYYFIVSVYPTRGLAVISKFGNVKYSGNVIIPKGISSIHSYSGVQNKNWDIDTLEIMGDFTFSNYSFSGANIKNIVVHGNVYKFEYMAFNESKINNVNVDGTIRSVMPYAFYRCENLCKFSFGEAVESIGTYAFCMCGNLGEFDFDNTDKVDIYAFKNTELANKWANNGKGYELITKQDGVDTTIKLMLPLEFTGDVVIPSGINSISYGAFRNSLISSCSMSDDVKYLGDWSFGNSKITKIQLSKNINTIPKNCFYNSNLAEINLDKVKTIANEAFTSTKIKESKIAEGVTFIGNHSFSDCKELERVVLPNTIKQIRGGAFYGCEKLKEVVGLENASLIEKYSFCNCDLEKVKFGSGLKALPKDSFTGNSNIKEVIIEDGCEKLEDAFGTLEKITYTIPMSVSQMSDTLLKKTDTVRCNHGSIAESRATYAGCFIEYLDNAGDITNTMRKAKIFSNDISEFIRGVIKDVYTNPDVDFEYTISQESVAKLNSGKFIDRLSDEQLDLLGITAVDAPEDYEEKAKFKFLLDYYAKVTDICTDGLSDKVLKMKDTLTVGVYKEIYSDKYSKVLEIEYKDNKFESKKAIQVVLITGRKVRYACLKNQYTSINCNALYSKDLGRLLNLINSKDHLAKSPMIGGTTYDNCFIKLMVDGELHELNLFNAIWQCAITVKLLKNKFLMILPQNNKILECTANNRDTLVQNLKRSNDKGCIIDYIGDLDLNKIVGKNSKSATNSNYMLLKELNAISDEKIKTRNADYANIGEAKITPYREVRDYCIMNGISKVEDMDTLGLSRLMSLPTVERRSYDWFDAVTDKNKVTSIAKYETTTSDNFIVRQYSTKSRVALTNPLLTGGDRTVYITEVLDRFGNRASNWVFASLESLDEMLENILSNSKSSGKSKKVYVDKYKFDTVSIKDIELIRTMYSISHDSNEGKAGSKSINTEKIWLTVYKPNGLYYISYVNWDVDNTENTSVILLIQIGNIDIMMDYMKCANSYNTSGADILKYAGRYAVNMKSTSRSGKDVTAYKMLLKARGLVIDGETDIKKFMEIGLPSNLSFLFGVNRYDDTIYDVPEYNSKDNVENKIESADDYEDYEIDMSDLDENYL